MNTKRTPYVSSMLAKPCSNLLRPVAKRPVATRPLSIAILIAMLFVGCKAQQQAMVSVPRNDSISVTRNDSAAIRHNSERTREVIRDSVIIREKGDTIRIDHWHYEIKDSIVHQTDTIFLDKEHIVFQDKEVCVELPPQRYVPSWAWYSLGASILFFILFLLRIFIRIYFRR